MDAVIPDQPTDATPGTDALDQGAGGTAAPDPPDPKKLTLLAQEESGGKRLQLFVDALKLRGYLTIVPLAPFVEIRIEEFEQLFASRGVIVSDDKRAELQTLIAEITDPKFAVEQLESFPPFLIATGKPPVDGQDGWIEWNVDVPLPNEMRVKIDAQTGQANFRELGRVVNVRERDLLCTVHEPTRGEPGVDVFGKPVPAHNGEKLRLQKGKGALFKEQSNEYLSEIDGCVKWNGQILSVEPVYQVNGDVDFNEGNIKFNGSVVVTGDVKEGFEIEARGEHGDIEIQGLVEDVRLCADGSVTLRGGASMGKVGRVEARQNVIAKYLMNARVQCDGDVAVQSDMVVCDVHAQGKVICQRRIVGGKIVALGGIDTFEAGVETGTRTSLIISLEHFETEEIRALDQTVGQLQLKHDQILSRVGPLLEDPKKLDALAGKMRDAVRQLIEQAEKIDAQIADFNERRNEIVRRFTQKIGNEIIIRKQLYPGVDVRIDTCRQIFLNTIAGPIKLKPNYAKGTIQISSL